MMMMVVCFSEMSMLWQPLRCSDCCGRSRLWLRLARGFRHWVEGEWQEEEEEERKFEEGLVLVVVVVVAAADVDAAAVVEEEEKVESYY